MAVQGRDMGVQGVGLGVQGVGLGVHGAVLLLLYTTCRADEFTRSLDSEGYLDIFQVPATTETRQDSPIEIILNPKEFLYPIIRSERSLYTINPRIDPFPSTTNQNGSSFSSQFQDSSHFLSSSNRSS